MLLMSIDFRIGSYFYTINNLKPFKMKKVPSLLLLLFFFAAHAQQADPKIASAAGQVEEKVMEWRRYFHQNPQNREPNHHVTISFRLPKPVKGKNYGMDI